MKFSIGLFIDILIFLGFIWIVYLSLWPQKIPSESMEPTFLVGDITYKAPLWWYSPVEGDVIAFECTNTDKCTGFIAHRWTKTDPDGCMHIEGDNQPDAWDTLDYGCLMPDEIEIVGAVYKAPTWINNIF